MGRRHQRYHPRCLSNYGTLMRDLSFLNAPSAIHNQGVLTTDPIFNDITRRAEDGELSEAADAVEALLAEGIYDIRLMTILLFAVFQEDGLSRLPELLSGLTSLLTQSTSHYGPSDRREIHVQKSLSGLLEKIERTLNYHIEKRDEAWGYLTQQQTYVEEALRSLDHLLRSQGDTIQVALEEPASKLRRTLRELLRSENEPIQDAKNEPKRSPEIFKTRSPKTSDLVELRGSPELLSLLDKLDAFEALARRAEFRKAALVAADIQETIEHFDPREYFPELFSTFGSLVSEHVDSIAPYWEQRESVSWRMLQQFYQVDLAAFVGDPKDG